MKQLRYLIAATLFANACGTQNIQSHLKIVGGKEVTPSDAVFKSTVGLTLTSGGSVSFPEPVTFCGGAMLDNHRIVTAASCFRDDINDLMSKGAVLNIVWGTNAMDVRKETSRVVQTHLLHTEFHADEITKTSPTAPANDLALLTYEAPSPDGFESAELVSPAEALKTGEQVWIAGYGSTRKESQETGKLLAAMSKFHSQLLPMKIVHFMSQDVSACHGDSGSPAYIQRNGKWLLLGTTSAANCRNYMRYTDLRQYQDTFLKFQ